MGAIQYTLPDASPDSIPQCLDEMQTVGSSSPARRAKIPFDARDMLDLMPVVDAALQRARHDEIQALRVVEAAELVVAEWPDLEVLVC